MITDIISIILSSILAVVAIFISISSLNRQTKSQKQNATIQLFDKRFEIYLFVVELWQIVGYFCGDINLDENKTYSYKEVLALSKSIKINENMQNKINFAYCNSNKYYYMQKCLFEGNVQKYLDDILSSFTIYITGIYFKNSMDKEFEQPAYDKIISLYKTKTFDLEELRQYIYLADIKRNDF